MKKTIFDLFSCALQNNVILANNNLSRSSWDHLFELATKHDLAHLVGYALKTSGIQIDDDLQRECNRSMDMAMFRYVKLNHELELISQTLSQAQIRFIPLKGAVIRKYYKEPWLRTSSDVDILVDVSNYERAKQLLMDQLKYSPVSTCNHDISFLTPNKIHVELHHILIDAAAPVASVTSTVWERSAPSSSNPFCYEMSDEMFYFYHIAHMAKHFENGGCGIRPFLDVWVLNHSFDFDQQKRYELLDVAGLVPFAKAAEDLSEVWLGNRAYTPLTRDLELYTLHGGTYGTIGNRVVVQQVISGSKFSYLMSRIFLSFHELKEKYPQLEKRKWLYPFYQVKRWFRIFKKGKLKDSISEAKATSAVSEEQNQRAARLLEDLGLR